jgi:hypothetical protein
MGRICGRCEREILDGKPEGKRPLERPRHRWEDNIKMDITNRVRGYKIDSHLSRWDPVVSSC